MCVCVCMCVSLCVCVERESPDMPFAWPFRRLSAAMRDDRAKPAFCSSCLIRVSKIKEQIENPIVLVHVPQQRPSVPVLSRPWSRDVPSLCASCLRLSLAGWWQGRTTPPGRTSISSQLSPGSHTICETASASTCRAQDFAQGRPTIPDLPVPARTEDCYVLGRTARCAIATGYSLRPDTARLWRRGDRSGGREGRRGLMPGVSPWCHRSENCIACPAAGGRRS